MLSLAVFSQLHVRYIDGGDTDSVLKLWNTEAKCESVRKKLLSLRDEYIWI